MRRIFLLDPRPLSARPWHAPPIAPAQDKVFRAGAAAVDIAPERFPVIVNGGFLAARASKLNDPIRAKCPGPRRRHDPAGDRRGR